MAAPSVAPPIVTRGLTKHFGAVRALESVDLEVWRGEIFGYLGPNGAGKTTTIRLLLDFLRPTRGTSEVLGGSGGDPAIRRRVGYLPSELHLDPRYTGHDVFDLFGTLRGEVAHQRIEQLCQRFHLDPSRRIGDLSTGNRRKVGIVAAFMNDPELYIVDEPTSGLDPLLQHEFHTLTREVVDSGATVLLSSHMLPEVEVLADRVAVLRHGEVVAVASVDELRARARQRLELHLADPDARPHVARFERLERVVDVAVAGDVLTVTFEGSADPVVKAAAGLDVTRVVTPDTDLEEIFLGFYQGGS